MINYDRQILIPYLRDVCSIESLCSVLTKEVNTCLEEINKLTHRTGKTIQKPQLPTPHVAKNGKYIFLIVLLGVVPLILGGLMAYLMKQILPAVAGVVLFLLSWLFWGLKIRKNNRKIQALNEAEAELYQNQLDHYEKETTQILLMQRQKQAQERLLTALKARLQNAQNLRNDVYSVNIIPSRYRNIQTAYYLYDYVDSSHETDVDRIIYIMVLDEIMHRTSPITEPMEMSSISQRMQLAIHTNNNKLLAESYRENLLSLMRTEKDPQLHLDYQKMLSINEDVTKFFLENDYLSKYH